jgi:hypothetical protein
LELHFRGTGRKLDPAIPLLEISAVTETLSASCEITIDEATFGSSDDYASMLAPAHRISHSISQAYEGTTFRRPAMAPAA